MQVCVPCDKHSGFVIANGSSLMVAKMTFATTVEMRILKETMTTVFTINAKLL